MASPQLEDGYTRIANELVEQLARINLSAYEWRFLWVLWRKTYGYHKKEDYISLSQFTALTGISKWHVSRTKGKLIKRGLVTQIGNKIRFNKDWGAWKRGYPKRQQLPKEATTVTQRGNKKLPKEVDTKEKKDKPTKDIIPASKKEGLKKEISALSDKKDPQSRIKHGWQDEALRMAEKLGIEFPSTKVKTRWMGVFKECYQRHRQGALISAYSYVIDNSKLDTSEDKMRAFLWKVFEILKK